MRLLLSVLSWSWIALTVFLAPGSGDARAQDQPSCPAMALEPTGTELELVVHAPHKAIDITHDPAAPAVAGMQLGFRDNPFLRRLFRPRGKKPSARPVPVQSPAAKPAAPVQNPPAKPVPTQSPAAQPAAPVGPPTAIPGAQVSRRSFPKDTPTKQTKQWSAHFRSEGEARALAREKLGANPVEVEPGKWRSADGKWQYRAKPGDVHDRHIHLEELDPTTGEVLQNLHLRWPGNGGR